MSGTLLFATLVAVAQPAPEEAPAETTDPDALNWEDLEEPEAPAPEAAPSEAETTTPEDATEPAPPAEAVPPEPEPEEPETSVEFTPAPEPERQLAELQPPGEEENRKRRPKSRYGRLWAGPVLGGGPNAIALGAAATYFVVPWIGLGAELVNVFSWDPAGSYYEFQFTPKATLLMLPQFRFSPIAWGGFGVDTFNKGLGTYGRWTGGGGFIMLLGSRLILTLGVNVDGRVPASRWNRTFACGLIRSNCTMGIGPVIGLSFPFG